MSHVYFFIRWKVDDIHSDTVMLLFMFQFLPDQSHRLLPVISRNYTWDTLWRKEWRHDHFEPLPDPSYLSL